MFVWFLLLSLIQQTTTIMKTLEDYKKLDKAKRIEFEYKKILINEPYGKQLPV